MYPGVYKDLQIQLQEKQIIGMSFKHKYPRSLTVDTLYSFSDKWLMSYTGENKWRVTIWKDPDWTKMQSDDADLNFEDSGTEIQRLTLECKSVTAEKSFFHYPPDKEEGSCNLCTVS